MRRANIRPQRLWLLLLALLLGRSSNAQVAEGQPGFGESQSQGFGSVGQSQRFNDNGGHCKARAGATGTLFAPPAPTPAEWPGQGLYGYADGVITDANNVNEMVRNYYRNPTQDECDSLGTSGLRNAPVSFQQGDQPGAFMTSSAKAIISIQRGLGNTDFVPPTCCYDAAMEPPCHDGASYSLAIWTLVVREKNSLDPALGSLPAAEWELGTGAGARRYGTGTDAGQWKLKDPAWSCEGKTVTGTATDTGIGGCFYKSFGEDCIDTGKICGASAACGSNNGVSARASGNGRCTMAMAQAGIPVGGDTADYGAGGSSRRR